VQHENFTLKFQAVAETSAMNFSSLLEFLAPFSATAWNFNVKFYILMQTSYTYIEVLTEYQTLYWNYQHRSTAT